LPSGPPHSFMPPIWPFKKKAPPIVENRVQKSSYSRGGDSAASDTLSDRSHVDDANFQAAMAALSTPHIEGAVASTPQESDSSVKPSSLSMGGKSSEAEMAGEKGEWVNHGDGYWYFKKRDGSFSPIPHIKNAAGELQAYQA